MGDAVGPGSRWRACAKSRTVACAAAAALVGALAGSPAGADAGTQRVPGSPRTAEALVSGAQQAVDGGTLVELLGAAGVMPAPTRPGAAGDFASAIAMLSDAVQQAGAIVRQAVPVDGLSAAGLRAHVRQTPAGQAASLDWFDDDTAAALDQALDQAALLVAGAVDAAMPALAGASLLPRVEEVVEGCDVVDQPPALCVAGSGDNAIAEDYALVVDVGGSDTHGHSAGGADLLGNDLPVSVTIDVDGNDTYAYSAPGADSPGATVAQGSALVGVGILLDAAGHDQYRVTAEGQLALAAGQGAGHHGIGILADGAGNDTYDVTATGPGPVNALGQADGANGVGILLDGGGDDRYVLEATATDYLELAPGVVLPPWAAAVGMGVGRLGTVSIQTPQPLHADMAYIGRGYGLLGDVGGADDLLIQASAASASGDEVPASSLIDLPLALTAGLGAGYSQAAGLAVLGSGDTTATVRSRSAVPRTVLQVDGMGVADNAGVGALLDAGGEDVRSMVGDATVERHSSSGDCATSCPAAPIATAAADATVVRGMGYGYSSGVGLLRDGAGSDRYQATSSSVAEATVADVRGSGAEAGIATAAAGSAWLAVQGVGEEFGWGELADTDGDDRYLVEAVSSGRAKATHGPAAPPGVSAATAGDASVLAQAAGRTGGSGHLVDVGGLDHYAATGTASAITDHPDGGVAGEASTGVLASVDATSWATFLDADDGAVDTHEASPASEACTGTRGEAAWVDCGGGAGVGAMT